MRIYVGEIAQAMHDIRAGYDDLHDPDTSTYPVPQAFARKLRVEDSWAGESSIGPFVDQVENVSLLFDRRR